MVTLYDLLGVKKDATLEEIRRAYHDCALRYHPDRNRRHEAVEAFLEVQKAYEVLSDTGARTAYDQELAALAGEPIQFNLLYSSPILSRIDEPQLVYAQLVITPSPPVTQSPMSSIILGIIIDRSTSMQGDRIDAVKDAVIELLRKINPGDRLSLVTFSDRAEVLASAARRIDTRMVENQILLIRPAGGTEMYQGIEAAFRDLQTSSGPTDIKHLVLITDGRTYGDEDACHQIAESCAAQGIQLTCIGIGTEWNDVFLDRLSITTGGTCLYLGRNSDLRRLLQLRLDSIRRTIANHVSIALTTAPGTRLTAVFRASPDPIVFSPESSFLKLGSVPRDGMSVLLEFQVDPIPPGVNRREISTVEMEYMIPSEAPRRHRTQFSLTLPVSTVTNPHMPPQPIFQALSHLTLYRMQERIRREVAQGKLEEAGSRLRRLATEFLRHNEVDLAQTAMMEAERLLQTQMLSAEGEKQIKYGTRALIPILAMSETNDRSKP